ncbi:SDR family oxidoreductase [bacterium]|nr:SDR family oxidoreductase [bacterium]
MTEGGRLKNKVAVITGAASGIGLATLERFVAEGASVLAADIQDEKGAGLEHRFGSRVVYRHCNVMDESDIKAAVETAAAHFGGLDILFSNAGAVGARGTIEEVSVTDFDATMRLLLMSVVAGAKHAAPLMMARGGGSIINTASVAGVQAGYGPIAYSTAKAAVVHFTRCAAAELSKHRIRINAICPGMIATSIFGDAFGLARPVADQMAAMLAERSSVMQPIPKPGLPEDIAATAAHLASDDAAFITGTHVIVDGGLTIGPRNAWDEKAVSPLLDVLGISQEQADAMIAARKAQGEF